MEKYDLYQKAKQNIAEAQHWIDLATAKDSQNGSLFSLSLPHSKIVLMRCGQHYASGKNYHESPEALNAALLKVIKSKYGEIMSLAMLLLKEEERNALIFLEEDIDLIKKEICAAKK